LFGFQNFEWPIAKRLENDDVLIVHLLSHQRHQCDKTLGLYTLPMDRVAAQGHVHLVDSFSDVNDRNLPVSGNIIKTPIVVLFSDRPAPPGGFLGVPKPKSVPLGLPKTVGGRLFRRNLIKESA